MMKFRIRCAGMVLAVLLLAVASRAQVQVVTSLITTFAGGGTGCAGQTDSLGDGCPAADSALRNPTGVAADTAGNLYISDDFDNVIRKVSAATGEITTVAGSGTGCAGQTDSIGDGCPATSAPLSNPQAVAVDSQGNFYVIDYGNTRIRKVTVATGNITTVAGNGTTGYTGDNNQATSAELDNPLGLAVNPSGTLLYIADTGNNVVRQVNLTTGVITTFAGNGFGAGTTSGGYTGDNNAATGAEMWHPSGVALDSNGNLYIADTYNLAIREVIASTLKIYTVAGNGHPPGVGEGDGGLATNANLYFPYDIAVDSAGDLFIADTSDCLIREVNAVTRIITTVAGNPQDAGENQGSYSGDHGPPTLANLNLPDGIAVDSFGNLYIADTANYRVRKVSAPNTMLNFPATAVGATAPSRNVQIYFGAYYTALPGQFPTEVPITLSSISIPQSAGGAQEFTIGALSGCVADGETPINGGSICTVPISFNPAYPGLREAPLELQTNAGPFYFGLTGVGIAPQPALIPGLITSVAGNGYAGPGQGGAGGYTGDNGPATSAELSSPFSVAFDNANDFFIADYDNFVIRKVSGTTGIITTVAGNGTGGYAGDNYLATGAEMTVPWDASLDASGNIYIADTNNNAIREVSAATGIITTVVGDCCAFNGEGLQGYNGDGIPAVGAELFFPESVATDTSGNLYIADFGNNRIREVNVATGIITTVAGNGFGGGTLGGGGYNGDNILATSAELFAPVAVALDSAGNLYIADFSNLRIRKVTAATGIITTVAGDGTVGPSGDNGPATSAELNPPIGIAVDAAGDLYITGQNAGIRKVDAATGTITTLVPGNSTGCAGETDTAGDGCAATSASLNSPENLGLDSAGNLYVADAFNERIRKISIATPPLDFPQTAVGSSSAALTFKVANIGSAPLSFSAITPTANFSVDSSTTTCSTSEAVPAGGSCVIGVVFSPTTGGATTGTLTLTDNALNVSGTTQQVVLNGTISTSSGTPDFTMTTLTPTMEVAQGGDSATYVITITAVNGFGGTIVPSTNANPAMGIQLPASVTIPPGGSQNFNIVITSLLSPSGPFPVTVTGTTAGGLQHSVVISLIVDKPALTPTVTVTPSSPSITTAQALMVTVTVGGGSGNPTPTGSVTLTSGTYASGAVTLSGGSATINIPAGSLATSLDTLTATYTPDSAGALNYANATGSSTVTVTAPSLSFVSNVDTALPSQPVTVNITTAGTPNSIQVLTQGQPGLDFTETSGGTCATTTAYTVGETCTVNVIFKPRVPGARPGAVLLTDASNDILGIAYLPGTGIGPEITFSPGVQSTLPSYSGQNAALPYGVAVDAGLNVYIADYINNWVIKMPWTGSAYGAPVQLPFTGLYTPEGVAVDGAGDVFVADASNSRVVELPWNGSSYGTQIVLASSGFETFPVPTGVAVDGHGNLFFAEIGHLTVPSALIEMPWTGSGYGSPTTITAATGLNNPLGVAVDANLNIYIADSGNNRVVEIPWNGTSFGTEIVVASGIGGAGAVAVDGGGDVYIANYGASTIAEVPWNGTAFGTPITAPFALGVGAYPVGIAVDGYGNLYVSNDEYEAIDKLSVSTPPSLSFANTNVGSVSTDSPQTVAVSNIGNASLIFSAGTNPNYPADFPENSSGTSLCAPASPLTQGGSCNVSINFKPTTSGPLSEDVVLTDNNLNVSGAMQSIAMGGTATESTSKLTPTLTVSPSAASITTTQALTVTVGVSGGSGNPTPTGSVVLTSGSYTSAATTLSSGSATINIPAGSLAVGADTLSVSYTPDSASSSTYNSATGSNTVTVTTPAKITPTLTVSPSPASITTAQGLTVTIGVSGGSGNPTPTGSVVLTSGSYNSAATTLTSGSAAINIPAGSLATGTDTLTVSYTPDSAGSTTYNSATGSNTVSVTAATVQVSVGTTPAGLSFTVDGTSYTSTQTLTWNVGSSHTIATTSPQTASGTQNTFASWSDAGAISHSVTAPSSAASYTAIFNTSYQLTTAANPSSDGTVTPAPGTYYASGTVVNLSATANSGYTFSNWTGNVASSSSASTTVTMNAPQTVTANFAVVSTVTVTLIPSALAFPNTTVGVTSAPLAITVNNTGNATLTIDGITITGTNPADFAIVTGANACGSSLAAGASCSIYVTFTPASATSFAATLSITDNASGGQTVTVTSRRPIAQGASSTSTQTANLTGTGTAVPAPVASLTAPAAFPNTTVGATAAASSATLSNTGNAALTISGITLAGTNPTDFAIATGSNACGSSLAAGASCSIYVTFTPASAANFAATLTVADNAAGSPQTAALTGTGTAAAAPTYTVASPTPAQTVQPGGAATYTINITPVNGSFTSLVTLSASGLPAGATATFLPASVTPGSAEATSQLTIQTAAVASVTERPSPWPLAAPALGLIGLFFVSGKRRRWITFGVLLFASLTAITALSGCGGGFGLGNVIPPPSSYTVTVTGTSGENVQTTTVQLTVQ